MKPTTVACLLACSLFALDLPVSAGHRFPEVISLPDGWGPEGIAVGRGTDFYAGARQGSAFAGAVYKGNLRTGTGSILVPPQAGRFALGLKLDKRSDCLFVAGGPGGAAYVYDGSTGAELATYLLHQDPSVPTFINDVIVTRSAAYFTDSRNPVLYVLPLGPGGALPEADEVLVLPLSGDFVMAPGFNANGIAATPNGKSLIIVQSNLGLLFRVDPDTGLATLIDLEGATVTSGDGLLLDGHTLYVCRNVLNQIAVIDLDRDGSSGHYVGDIISPEFKVPTTIAEFGHSLYAVNARFDQPLAPSTQYQVVRVRKENRGHQHPD